MTDLHAKITHRLSELRAVAEAATPGPWTTPGPDTVGEWMIYGEKWAVAYAAVTEHPDPPPALRDGIGGEQANHNAAHIATWNPAHSLRWIEWAEEVADRHMPALGNDLLIWCWACNRSPDFCAELAGLASALDIEVTG